MQISLKITEEAAVYHHTTEILETKNVVEIKRNF